MPRMNEYIKVHAGRKEIDITAKLGDCSLFFIDPATPASGPPGRNQ